MKKQLKKPPLKETKSVPVNIRVTPRIKKLLVHSAALHKTSMSNIVAWGIENVAS